MMMKGRLAGVFLVLSILPGFSGCEYFTSAKLGRLKPTTATTTEKTPAEAVEAATSMSPAEMVALLERIIRGNRRELDDLLAVLEDRSGDRGEEAQARDVFQVLDDLKNGLERERKKAENEGRKDRLADVDRQLQTLQAPWELARERLNLDLRARMLILERLGILRAGIVHDQRRLEAILISGDPAAILTEPKPPAPGPADPQAPSAETPTTTTTTTTTTEATEAKPAPAADVQSLLLGVPAATPPADESKDKPKDEAKAKAEPEKTDEAKAAEAKADEAKAGEAKAEEPKTGEAKAGETKAKETSAPKPSKELIAAKRDLETKSGEVQSIRERAISLDARIKSIARSIEILGMLSGVANQSLENATQTRTYLIEEMKKGKPSVVLQAWTKQGDDPIALMDDRIKDARENVERFGERHAVLLEERGLIDGALRTLVQRARSATEDLSKTQEMVEALESPFSTHRMLSWIRHNGPPILATIVVMTVLYLGVTRYSHKIIHFFASRGMRGTKAERDNRMETLVSVLQNTGSAVVLVGGALTLLGQVGIPVGPLLGGAAVVGVAVAFGAQNLIKDFFYGFMILLENQYKLNDVVKIGDHSGAVEQITLRMTALRDMEGSLHFLPNGATTSVINMTHGWSRALFNVRIGVAEDVDRVIGMIQDLGKEFRQDPAFRLVIVDDLTMLGVDGMTETAITLVFFIKTLPGKQWDVKREFLKRLKKRLGHNEVILPPPLVINPPPQ